MTEKEFRDYIFKEFIVDNKIVNIVKTKSKIEQSLNSFESRGIYFCEKLYLFLFQVEEKICEKEGCSNKTEFKSFSAGYRKYCCNSCSSSDKKTLEKKRNTTIEKYGNLAFKMSKETAEKRKKTNLEKYGVDNVFKLKEIREKSNKTATERYGSATNSAKRKQTSLERYGVENTLQLREIREKIEQTNLERHGVKHFYQREDVKEKIKNTNIKRFGAGNYRQSVESKRNIYDLTYDKFIETNRLNNLVIPQFNKKSYEGVLKTYRWKCCKCDSDFISKCDDGRVPRCEKCFPITSGSSLLEKEVVDFVKSLNVEVIENDRDLISPKELDIYIPSHNLAIEFDGIYWHSETKCKDREYHLDKTKKCKEIGIDLIHIFETEWLCKREIIENIIKFKLGLEELKETSMNTGNTFLDLDLSNDGRYFYKENRNVRAWYIKEDHMLYSEKEIDCTDLEKIWDCG